MNQHKENRPWGEFIRFTLNEKSTVKILIVKEGEETSLQTHENRSEFWRVLEGSGEFTIDSEIKTGQKDAEFLVSQGGAHKIKGLTGGVRVLEISLGDFDEHDIKRISDKYNRDTA